MEFISYFDAIIIKIVKTIESAIDRLMFCWMLGFMVICMASKNLINTATASL